MKRTFALALFVLFSLANTANAGIVQTVTCAANNTNFNFTCSITPTSTANTLVAFTAWSYSSATVSDTQQGSYTLDSSIGGSASAGWGWFHVKVVSTSAATVTFDAGGVGNASIAFVSEVSGLSASPFDVGSTTKTSSTSSPVTSGNIITTVSDIIFAVYFSPISPTLSSPQSGYAIIIQPGGSSGQGALASSAGIAAGTNAVTVSSNAVSGTYPTTGIAAGYKLAAVGVKRLRGSVVQ